MGSYDITMKETAACKLTIIILTEGVGGQHVGWHAVGKKGCSNLIYVYGHESIRRFGLHLFFLAVCLYIGEDKVINWERTSSFSNQLMSGVN